MKYLIRKQINLDKTMWDIIYVKLPRILFYMGDTRVLELYLVETFGFL